jgi:hypothetical protein
MLIPLRSNNSPAGFPLGSIAMMAVHAVAFVCFARTWTLSPKTVDGFATAAQRLDPGRQALAFLVHNNAFQLALTIWMLALVGCALEGWIGTPKFLGLYFAGGLAGAFAKLGLMQAVPQVARLLGPGSALLAMLGAAAYVLPHTKYDIWDGLGLFRPRSNAFSYKPTDSGWLDRFWGRHTYSDPVPISGESIWPLWVLALYFMVLQFLLTWQAASPGAFLVSAAGLPVGVLLPILMRQDREDVDVSDALAVYAETRDLGLLSSDELQALYRADPGNTTVLLNWVNRTLVSRWGIAPSCLEAFRKGLPAIIEYEPPESVASVVLALNKRERVVDSRFEIYLGTRLEAKRHNQLAIDVYEAVRRSHDATPEDAELALFRLGSIYEKQLFNPYGAAFYYRELLSRFPRGSLASQAQTRLAIVSARLTS